MHTLFPSGPGRRVLAGFLLFGAFMAAVFFIWLRNRDILRDLYDYSTVVTAAGKVSAGLRPYTDVRSPMQTSVYYFNWLTEAVFGANYLALTKGGLLLALAGGSMLAWMLRRTFGGVGAALLAGAVMLAGLVQHVVIFYNPVGIVCFGVVIAGLAANPRLWPVRSLETLLVYAALFIGGTNKLNFQALTVAMGALLILRAWRARDISGRDCGRSVALLFLAGVAAPLAFELLWTGASFRLWLDEVLLMPVARHQAIKTAWDLKLLLGPPHEFHHHLLFRPMGGFGLALLLGVGGWALWRKPDHPRDFSELALRAALVLAGGAGAALLMVTNHETIMLTTLAFLLSAAAIFVACRRPGVRGDRWVGYAIVAASFVWSGCGGYAAWHGSRVLYAPDPPPRSEYVRLHQAPRALVYFEGVRFPAPMLASLKTLAQRVRALESSRGGMRGVLFGPAVEWLERAYPEAIVPDMPIWYHSGTSLSEQDGPWFNAVLQRQGVKRIVTDANWEIWPQALEQSFRENYRAERVGSRFRIYHPRVSRPALLADAAVPEISQEDFRVAAESNVLLAATQAAEGMALQRGPRGGFFGRRGGSAWAWPLGPAVVGGSATAVIEGPGDEPGLMIFRILAGPRGASELLWEMPVRVRRGQRVVDVPFHVTPLGRPLLFQVQVSRGLRARAIAGWRQLRITQAGPFAPIPTLPIARGLQRLAVPGDENAELWFAKPGAGRDSLGWSTAPFEHWRRQTGGFSRIRVAAEFEPVAGGSEVAVTLAWYRAGRYEIMSRRTVDVSREPRISLEGGVPEGEGWVGLMVSPVTPQGIAPLARIQSWRLEPPNEASVE